MYVVRLYIVPLGYILLVLVRTVCAYVRSRQVFCLCLVRAHPYGVRFLQVAKFGEMMDKCVLQDTNGLVHVPELYYVPADKVQHTCTHTHTHRHTPSPAYVHVCVCVCVCVCVLHRWSWSTRDRTARRGTGGPSGNQCGHSHFTSWQIYCDRYARTYVSTCIKCMWVVFIYVSMCVCVCACFHMYLSVWHRR